MRDHQRDLRADALAWIDGYTAAKLATRELAGFARRVVAVVVAEIPALGADAAIRRDLDASTHDAIRTYLSRVPQDQPDVVDPPPAARDLGRSLAQRGHEVGVLLNVYRVGLRAVWREIMADVCRADLDDDLRAAILDYLFDHLSRTVDHVVDELVGVYFDEVERRMRGAVARKVETVHALLREEPMDIDAAVQRLGHNLHRPQTGLVLWTSGEEDQHATMEALAREIAAQAGATAPLAIPSGPQAMWAWLAGAAALDPRSLAPTLKRHPGIRVSAGIPAPGLGGFRTSHAQAVMAQTVAMDSDIRAEVTLYQDVELVSCMSANPAAMRALIARELAGLAQPDPAIARLRETVLVYLETGSSNRAAEALGVHKNTVLYRLQQAEEHLGHRIDERKLALEIALRIVATYGDRVLPTP